MEGLDGIRAKDYAFEDKQQERCFHLKIIKGGFFNLYLCTNKGGCDRIRTMHGIDYCRDELNNFENPWIILSEESSKELIKRG